MSKELQEANDRLMEMRQNYRTYGTPYEPAKPRVTNGQLVLLACVAILVLLGTLVVLAGAF